MVSVGASPIRDCLVEALGHDEADVDLLLLHLPLQGADVGERDEGQAQELPFTCCEMACGSCVGACGDDADLALLHLHALVGEHE